LSEIIRFFSFSEDIWLSSLRNTNSNHRWINLPICWNQSGQNRIFKVVEYNCFFRHGTGGSLWVSWIMGSISMVLIVVWFFDAIFSAVLFVIKIIFIFLCTSFATANTTTDWSQFDPALTSRNHTNTSFVFELWCCFTFFATKMEILMRRMIGALFEEFLWIIIFFLRINKLCHLMELLRNLRYIVILWRDWNAFLNIVLLRIFLCLILRNIRYNLRRWIWK